MYIDSRTQCLWLCCITSTEKVFFDRANDNNLLCCQPNTNDFDSHFTAGLYSDILLFTDEHGQTVTAGVELEITRHQLNGTEGAVRHSGRSE